MVLVLSGHETACYILSCSFGDTGMLGWQSRVVTVGEWAEFRFPISVMRNSQEQFLLHLGLAQDTPSPRSPVTSRGAEFYASSCPCGWNPAPGWAQYLAPSKCFVSLAPPQSGLKLLTVLHVAPPYACLSCLNVFPCHL